MSKDEEQYELASPRLKAFYRFAAIFITVGLLLIIGLLIFMQNSPAYGTITEPGDTTAKPAEEKPDGVGTKQYNSTYYSFEYPDTFVPLSGYAKTSGQLDLLVLDKTHGLHPGESARANFSLERLPSGGVLELNPYNLVEVYPEKYVVEQKTIKSEQIYVLTRTTDGPYKQVLWPHGSMVLIITMTTQASAGSSGYDSFLNPVLQSIVWSS